MGTRNEKVQIVVSAKDKASATLSKVKNQVIGIGAAYLGFRGIKSILSSITEVGMQHERMWTSVAGALKRHNIALDAGMKNIMKFSDELQTLTGISDEVIGAGVKTFIDYGQSIESAKETMRVAADFAAGSGFSLKTAIDLLAKASVGYTGTLARYGLIIDETIPKEEKFAAAIQLVKDRFEGSASDIANTASVKMALIQEVFGDLQEQIFNLFSPALISGVETVTNVIASLIGHLSAGDVVGQMADLRTEMESIGSKTQGLVATYSQLITETNLNVTGQNELKTVTQQLAELVPTAVTAWNEYGEAVGINTEKIEAYVEAQQQAARADFLRSVENLRDSWKELSGVDTAAIATGLGDIRQEIEGAVGVAAALPKQLGDVDPMMQEAFGATQQANIAKLNTALQDGIDTLRETKEEIGRLLAVGSTAYPELAAGTTAYKEAVALLGQEYVNQIIAFQGQGEIRKVAIAAEFEQQKIGHTNNLYLQQQSAEWTKANASETTKILTAEQELVNLSHEIGAEVGAQAYEELRINGEKSSRKRVNAMIAGVSKETKAFVDAKRFQIQMGEQFKAKAVASMRSLVSQSVDAMIDGRGKIGDIFKAMAVDFTKFFIKQALAAIANLFIPGLGSLLSGIFDTPRYDLMAMEQGRHFAQHFTRGALGEMGGFPNQFVPTIASYNPMLNASNGPAAGTVINITVSADVDEGSVRSKIAPILEELANNRFTNIVNDESTITGESAIEFA